MSVWSIALVPARDLARGLTLLSAMDGPRVAVVLEAEEPWWRKEIEKVRPDRLHVQPFDRGSGIATLLALIHIFRDDPSARLVILRSLQELEAVPAQLAHLGSDAIVAIRAQGNSPPAIIARAGALLHLFHDSQRAVLRSFLQHQGSLDRLYPWLPEIDLERDVLRLAPRSARPAMATPPVDPRSGASTS